MKWIDTLLEYLFPPKCAGCNTIGFELCEKCIHHIRNSHPKTIKTVYVGFSYQDPIVKRTLKALKFKKRKQLGKILGELLFEKISEDLYEERAFTLMNEIIIIPIPLSRQRFNERGFNQSEIIARGFASCDTTMHIDTSILLRTRHSTPQSNISLKRERLSNIQGVFKVKKIETLKGKTCILFDDIVTTGATLNEAAKSLKESGVKKIIFVSVAH